MEHRRLSKQVMERQRRARINASLDRLKELLRHYQRVEPERLQRLEKADILELTVNLLQGRRRCSAADEGEVEVEAISTDSEETATSSASSSQEDSSCQSAVGFHHFGIQQHCQQLQTSAAATVRKPLACMENSQRVTASVTNVHACGVWRPW